MDRQRVFLVICLLSCILCGACATSLFKVKPVTELRPLPANSRSADAGGVTVRVAPLLSDEQTQELFEANLPVAGVLPVRVALHFQSGVPIEVKRARFVVRDGQNREWKMLATRKAVSQIMKANGVFAYNPHSKKQFESDFSSYALDLKASLDSSHPERDGFLFFQSPDKRPVDNNQKLSLVVDRLPQPVTIPLN